MAISALSPKSVMASPVNVNPQVSADLQRNVAQTAENAQKTVKAAQTDTVTISSQALKMADDKNASAKEVTKRADTQQASRLASYRDDSSRNTSQRSTSNTYSAVV